MTLLTFVKSIHRVLVSRVILVECPHSSVVAVLIAQPPAPVALLVAECFCY